MPTEELSTCEKNMPRLEYYPPDGDGPDCSPLRSFPFTIGRGESVDLQIDSSRVSREHAVVTREQDRFRIRDLRSTNGTFLNGEPIQEASLNDGDILAVADTEFTFLCEVDRPAAGVVTQVMSQRRGVGPRDETARNMITDVRRMHEMLMHRAVAVDLREIVALHNGSTFGWSMFAYHEKVKPQWSATQGLVSGSSSHLAVSLRQLARVTAVNELTKRERAGHFFFPISSAELEDLVTLKSHLLRLNDEVPESVSLTGVLRKAALQSDVQSPRLCEVLDATGVGLAFESPVSDGKQVLEYADARPSYVILTANGFQGIAQRRPARRQLSAVLDAFGNLGCQAIAQGISVEDTDMIRKLGFSLAIQSADAKDLSAYTADAAPQCSSEEVPTEAVQSTLEEIAEVTARIRAPWTDGSS